MLEISMKRIKCQKANIFNEINTMDWRIFYFHNRFLRDLPKRDYKDKTVMLLQRNWWQCKVETILDLRNFCKFLII